MERIEELPRGRTGGEEGGNVEVFFNNFNKDGGIIRTTARRTTKSGVGVGGFSIKLEGSVGGGAVAVLEGVQV